MIECPNHDGSFDCTPFCQLCEGNQELLPSKLIPAIVKDHTITPRQLINLGTWLLEEEITGCNMAVVIDALMDEELRARAAA